MLKPETVDRALGAIKGHAQYEYFFDRLNSPAWLKPLADRDFFKHPQLAEKVDPYIRFRFWPELRYLVRMSKIPEAQPEVLEIALKIPSSDNSRVYDDLAEIAFSMPPDLGARLVPKLLEGVRLPVKLLLKERVGEIIEYLAEGGQGNAAKALALGALALSPDPEASAKEEERLLFPEPRALFEDFYYHRIVAKALPALVRALGIDAVQMFADLLDEAILFSQKGEDSGNGEDYLYVAHPAIEAGSGRDDIPGILLYALRDAAEQLITASPGQLTSVLAVFKLKRWSSFKRLELHLCGVFLEDGGLDIAEAMFQEPDILNRALHHEAVLLLKASFARWSDPAKKRLLEWVDRGRPEAASRRWLEISGQQVTEANIRQIGDIWKRDHLAILQGQLPEPYQRKLEEFVARIGSARQLAEPDRISGGPFGAVSPKAPGEFDAMSVAEIIEFLASWTPGTDLFDATAEGAGQGLSAAIGARLDEFVAAANDFRRLDPTYVRSLFGALTAALKEKREFDWKPVLNLAAWVSSQPKEIPDRKGGGLFIADPDWGWSRDAIIDLLSTGFDQGLDGRLTLDLRATVWKALQPLTEDPNPTLADEAPDPKKSTSPVIRRFAAKNDGAKEPDLTSISINTTRGRAMRAVFKYARWIRHSTDKQRVNGEGPSIGLDAMPEVQEVLDAHLDLTREPTRTIRSVYGDHLVLLAWLDWKWLEANLGRILPLDAPEYPFFRAAWSGFVAFNQPNTRLLKLLTRCYRTAIQRLGKDIIPRHAVRSPEDAIAEHLMTYYWQDALDFGGADQLLDEFFALASGKVRGHAIWYIGISVPDWKDEAPPAVYARLQRLFDWRLEAARNAPVPEAFRSELANFGFWFTSEKFDERWSITTLLAALRLSKKTASEMDVVKRLAELCPQYPAECVECLRLMLEGDSEGWMLVGVEETARAVLRQALDSNDTNAAFSARRLTENLIGKGYSGFRTLLS